MKQYWSSVPGIVYIDVPDNVPDVEVTVIGVLLDGKIDLYLWRQRPDHHIKLNQLRKFLVYCLPW